MSLFNEEQLGHMSYLAKMAEQGKVCPCGWYSKDECASRCQSPYGSPEAAAANRAKPGQSKGEG